MAGERLPVDAALDVYLDSLADVPEPLAGLYVQTTDDPMAMMMTHPDLGRLLEVLVRATGGRAVLELGTFVGISAGWMARGLGPEGRIDTLEVDPARATTAAARFAAWGLGERIRVHPGPAADTLPGLPDAAYDLCYLDADKTGYPAYLAEALRLVRPGGLIVADNVLAAGRVARPPADDDASTAALRRFTADALAHPRLATSVLTVGDGVVLSVVL